MLFQFTQFLCFLDTQRKSEQHIRRLVIQVLGLVNRSAIRLFRCRLNFTTQRLAHFQLYRRSHYVHIHTVPNLEFNCRRC
jgi:hypothetical protein